MTTAPQFSSFQTPLGQTRTSFLPGTQAVVRMPNPLSPAQWDSMTELLLMYAARRSHLNDTILPALQQGQWVVCDRFADSSRAFQGIAGDLGLEIVEKVHQLVVGSFEPDMVLILDIPESLALQRALGRGGPTSSFP